MAHNLTHFNPVISVIEENDEIQNLVVSSLPLGRWGLLCGIIHDKFKHIIIEPAEHKLLNATGKVRKKSHIERIMVLRNAFEIIMKPDINTVNFNYIENNREHKKWINSVLLFFAARQYLFLLALPVITMPTE